MTSPADGKQWWLPLTTLIINSDENRPNGTHVIKYSLYKMKHDDWIEACIERDKLKSALEQAIKDRSELQTEIDMHWRPSLEKRREEIERLKTALKQKEGEIGRAEHRGNTVDYIYDKLENYSRQLGEVGPKLTLTERKLEKALEALKKNSETLDSIKFDLEASVYTLSDDEFETVFFVRDNLDRAIKEIEAMGADKANG